MQELKYIAIANIIKCQYFYLKVLQQSMNADAEQGQELEGCILFLKETTFKKQKAHLKKVERGNLENKIFTDSMELS